MRFISERVKHDSALVHKGANGDADFLSNQLFKRFGVNLQRDHFELLLSALHDVFTEDLRTQRLWPHFAGFPVGACRLRVDVLHQAIEQVQGTLSGKKGSFVLQHFGIMHQGLERLVLEVVPDSGTGELWGLKGKMAITIENGQHYYEFDYALG